VRTSEREKGLLDECELAVGDEDIIIPLSKASLVYQGVKSGVAGCLMVEPDTEADMLEHDALHDALALERHRQWDMESDGDGDERKSRSCMLLAIPEGKGLDPDDDKLLLSTGEQTPEGAEDSWLLPVKRDDCDNGIMCCDNSKYRDVEKKESKQDDKSKKQEGPLIKAIRGDVSCVTNRYLGAASIDVSCSTSKSPMRERDASNACEKVSTGSAQRTKALTRVPASISTARPPSRLKPPSSRSNFFSETSDMGERKESSCTSESNASVNSFGINSSIKKSNQIKTTNKSNINIGDGTPVAANGKPTSRRKNFGSLISKGPQIGQTTRLKAGDGSKQVHTKSQSGGHAGPGQARKNVPMDSSFGQPREKSSGIDASDSIKSPPIDRKKIEEGSHGKESPATARLRWLEKNPHLAFGGGSRLANTPPKDAAKPLRKTAEQLHFEAWGNNL